MFDFTARLFKRLAILVPGLAMAYVGARDIFPIFDKLLPDMLAILATYIIVAYGLIPALLRLIRIVFKPRHIPLYCTTPDGFASDPVNIGVVGTREQLIEAMTKAGWYEADRLMLQNMTKLVLALLFGRPYKHAPFSNLYLFGRSQDIGFQLPAGKSARQRHHVRFWAATYDSGPRFREHVSFWQSHQKSPAPDRILWVGAASLDVGLAVIRHTAQLTHMVHPDTTIERELIVKHLKKTGHVASTKTIKLVEPYKISNRVWRGYLTSDGKLTICELR